MNRAKARLCLFAMIVLAVVIGTVYYIFYIQKDTVITEGTLVENLMEEQGGNRDCIYQNRA